MAASRMGSGREPRGRKFHDTDFSARAVFILSVRSHEFYIQWAAMSSAHIDDIEKHLFHHGWKISKREAKDIDVSEIWKVEQYDQELTLVSRAWAEMSKPANPSRPIAECRQVFHCQTIRFRVWLPCVSLLGSLRGEHRPAQIIAGNRAQDHLWRQPPKEPFSTRAWYMLSDALKSYDNDIGSGQLDILASGCLSPHHATQFRAFVKQIKNRYALISLRSL
ncbi:MAG: hypothetical protein LBB76_09880 [Azoarcus sp.]|jgi:hypothetical protein|nr:hypothetical protein [Azoarcus sp.]